MPIPNQPADTAGEADEPSEQPAPIVEDVAAASKDNASKDGQSVNYLMLFCD